MWVRQKSRPEPFGLSAGPSADTQITLVVDSLPGYGSIPSPHRSPMPTSHCPSPNHFRKDPSAKKSIPMPPSRSRRGGDTAMGRGGDEDNNSLGHTRPASAACPAPRPSRGRGFHSRRSSVSFSRMTDVETQDLLKINTDGGAGPTFSSDIKGTRRRRQAIGSRTNLANAFPNHHGNGGIPAPGNPRVALILTVCRCALETSTAPN
jgi:hypothetical protein